MGENYITAKFVGIYSKLIKNLKIRRYIFIRELDLDFYEGLNIFTGETGAGKSIILEAIQSLFNYRLTKDLIQEGESSAYLEGTFLITTDLKKQLTELFSIETDLENQELIISREISKSNNKARINGRIVPVKILPELAQFLVDLHGQGSSYRLLEGHLQLSFLDSYLGAEHLNKLNLFQKKFKSLKRLERELLELKEIHLKKEQEQDYLEFSLEEINKLNLESSDEEAKLTQKIELLSNLEERNLLIQRLEDSIQSEESSLPEIKTNLNKLSSLSKQDQELTTLLEQAQESLESLTSLLKELGYLRLAEIELSEIDQLNSRLSAIQKLKQKHRLNSLEELFSFKEELENQIQNSDYLEKQIKELEESTSELSKDLLKRAKIISLNREKVLLKFSSEISKELRKLAFKGLEFKTDFQKNSALSIQGLDQIDFQTKVEREGEFKSLRKTASGGELSRISLTLKSLKNTNSQKSEQVVIFDEIDAGTSGQVSSLIGEKLFQTSLKEQVICITHQPLVACYADFYFLVKKEVDQKVNIQVKELKEQKEIIKALSSLLTREKETTQTTQNYLREIISQAKEFKDKINR